MTPAVKPLPPLRLSGQPLARRNKLIDEREQQKCAKCGVTIWAGASRHHRKFRSRRGGDEVSNGLLMCGSGTTGCHGWAHMNPRAARELGFAVLSHEDPTQVAVKHAIHGWVFLDDLGGVHRHPPKLELTVKSVRGGA